MDRFDALTEIRRLATQHNLAVAIITPEDILSLKGIDGDEDGNATPEQVAVIADTWEWNNFGDNWSDWFEDINLEGLA